MASGGSSQARWMAIVLGVALAASAVITYMLVELTSPAHRNAASPTASTVTFASRSNTSSPSDDASPSTQPPPTTPPPSTSPSATLTTPEPTFPNLSSISGANSTEPSTPTSPSAPTTATSVLDGSEVVIPAAWSGTAKVTVSVLGDCATATPSVYTDIPTNLALDLTQNELISAAPTSTAAVPDGEPTLTLGVGTDGLPKIAVYSSIINESGAFQRYWDLSLTLDDGRTAIHGMMRRTASDGNNPNFLADSETSLQPCESVGTVSLPKPLAAGSTLHGWVSTTHAELTLTATTTDGKRSVTVEFTADRKQ